MRHVGLAAVAAALLLSPGRTLASEPPKEPTKEQVEFFEKKVRPVLAEKCFSCHSEAQKKNKGGLVVDTLAGLLQGGDSGPSVVPGDPVKSKLIEAVAYKNDDLKDYRTKLWSRLF